MSLKQSAAARSLQVIAALVALTLLGSPIAPASPHSAEWVTVTDRSLEIVSGSPLDFSDWANSLEGDVPLRLNGDQFVMDGKTPEVNCATLAPGFSNTKGSGFPDHATADRYAIQLRRHGYNLARFHFIDALLMQGAKADFAFDPEQLDRFQYLLGALRKNGIRWMLDLMSSDNAALGSVFPHRWAERRGMLIRVFVEPAAFAHWRALATKLMTTRNPYTGLPLAQDPYTAALILANEDTITMQSLIGDVKHSGRFPDMLQRPYANWLKAQGLDPAQAEQLPAFSSGDAAMARFQQFISARQIETSQAMQSAVSAMGYSGPTSHFDNWAQLNMVPSRRDLPFVDMHGYDQVPPDARPGALVKAVSSFDDAGRYLQHIAGARFFGRPFTVTEHDQIFWNPYRYESGIAASAIAGLQGWNFICRHADGPIDLAYDGAGIRKDALYPDGGGLDPVARAGETLTALLMLRREITPARATIGVELDDAAALAAGGWREIPPWIGAIAWFARIGFTDPRSRQAGIIPDLTVALDPPPSYLGRAAATVQGRFARTAPIVDALRARGLIGKNNITDPSRNRWESPDGQTLLLGDRRQLIITTAFTAAMAFERLDAPVTIGTLRIERADAPALVALSALDGKPFAQSHRMLAILASDARNSGMQTKPDGTLIALGKLPIQIRRVRVSAAIAAPDRSRWRLTALRLNGSASQTIELTADTTGLALPLDTALSSLGPTTFFLIERVMTDPETN